MKIYKTSDISNFIKDNKSLIYYFFVYLSLAIFCIYLYLERMIFLSINNNFLFLVSGTLMLTIYIFSTVGWQQILKQHNIIINFQNAFVSENLSVLGRYLPGKVWQIIGPAGYLAKEGHNFGVVSMVGIKIQIISIWCGLVVGSVAVIFFGVKLMAIWLIILSVLSIFLFNESIHLWMVKTCNSLFKKNLSLPFVPISESIVLILIFLVLWLVWTAAFYLFCLSVSPNFSLAAAFIFPLAINLGNFAIFIPGGIGVREAIIAGFLVLGGIPALEATAVSITARVWCMIGELLIFFAAWLINLFYLKGQRKYATRS